MLIHCYGCGDEINNTPQPQIGCSFFVALEGIELAQLASAAALRASRSSMTLPLWKILSKTCFSPNLVQPPVPIRCTEAHPHQPPGHLCRRPNGGFVSHLASMSHGVAWAGIAAAAGTSTPRRTGGTAAYAALRVRPPRQHQWPLRVESLAAASRPTGVMTGPSSPVV